MHSTLLEPLPTLQPSSRTKYAVVGTGGRIAMFIDPLARDFHEHAELVGMCDSSHVRASYHQKRLVREYGYHEVPVFPAADFDRMVQETEPDVVIVCTVDATHHEYIVRALELGCDVVTEKPMTTDAEKCRAILQAAESTGKHVRVSFNYRWGPGPTKIRELIANGTIGEIKAVNLEYQLNTSHGADYFRRWHSDKSCSGGLLVHKSTHHFDLVNWWIDSIPQEVFASGSLSFYGEENALARGDAHLTGYDRYADPRAAEDDPFAFSLRDGPQREIYRNAEGESGYIRDRNVFRRGITIEDTMCVLVKYRTGVLLNYSLVAYSPLEGFRVTFTGDRGRIEYSEMHSPHIIVGQSDTELAAEQASGDGHQMRLHVFPHFQPGYEVPVAVAEGGHGGGDPLLQEQIFSNQAPQEEWGRNAGQQQGAASVLIGVAANRSMVSGLPVRIDSLCDLKPEARHLDELI